MIAALDRMRPGTAEQLSPLLGPPPPPAFEGLVTALINELADEPGAGEMLLILDDYHLIDAQPVHASLGFLLEHRPAALRLVLASRADPPLGLARLRGRGSWPNCAPPSCASPSRRRRRCCARRSGPPCLRPPWRR